MRCKRARGTFINDWRGQNTPLVECRAEAIRIEGDYRSSNSSSSSSSKKASVFVSMCLSSDSFNTQKQGMSWWLFLWPCLCFFFLLIFCPIHSSLGTNARTMAFLSHSHTLALSSAFYLFCLFLFLFSSSFCLYFSSSLTYTPCFPLFTKSVCESFFFFCSYCIEVCFVFTLLFSIYLYLSFSHTPFFLCVV